ncbi:MAG: sigma-70 family RNA polymerase sigma factor [Bacteroidota bacterium]
MEQAFLEILEIHQGIIYKVCNIYRDIKEDQEDLFQEIVLQLWKAFPKFKKEAKISTWIYRIALNRALAKFRKNEINLAFKADIPQTQKVNQKESISGNKERLFEAIRKLNQAERALIALYLEDYPYREIAAITGITENYVGVKISRIKEKLKIILNKK